MKMTGSASDIPGDLLGGRWAVWAHEWADDAKLTPDEWRDRVRAACEEKSIDCEMVVIDRLDLTIVFNKAEQPTFDQVQESIREVVRNRWMKKD